jgi:uncharacterized heparinase superfamily protein
VSVEAIADRTRSNARLAALLAGGAFARLKPQRLLRFSPPFSEPDHLLLSPLPVALGDARRGAELYGGRFAFAGHSVETKGNPVFGIAPPSEEWAKALHCFGWLADLAAADTALTRAFARTSLDEWISTKRLGKAGRGPSITARRLISWLTHAPFLLNGADAGFRKNFFRSLVRHEQRLKRDLRSLSPGMPRLTAAVALTQAGLCLPDATRALRMGSDFLASDLKALVLLDGGPATRNPDDLLAMTVDLLMLKENFARRSMEPPKGMMQLLDRMLPMLRFFRHADGNLALFNGAGPTDRLLLDSILTIDDTQGRPVMNAGYSGYQRIEAGRTVLVADTGRPPPLGLSETAHAGTLSFEMSVGAERLVVNCGAPGPSHAPWRDAARKTAAHSTVTLDDRSSCRFVRGRLVTALVGRLVREGPNEVDVKRDDGRGGTVLRAIHDGYAKPLGLVHERTFRVHADGNRVEGMDVIRPVRQRTTADTVLRFHLHPGVRAARLGRGNSVLLTLPSGDCWTFAVDQQEAHVEESVFFAGDSGPRRAEQIVVRLGRKAGTRVAWSLTHTGNGAGPGAPALF